MLLLAVTAHAPTLTEISPAASMRQSAALS